jgi:hypothetical protein
VETAELNTTYEQLQSDWATHLKQWGVPELPSLDLQSPNARLLQLILLRRHMGEAVEKNEIGRFVQRFLPTASLDQQCRHWKSDGWNVQGRNGHDGRGQKLPSGYYCLGGLTPSPEFMAKRTRELGRFAARDWESLQAAYGSCCGMCGAKGQKLEKGHMDPRKPLTLENTIPLCVSCNRFQESRFVVNEQGRPVTILAAERNKSLFAGLDARERRILVGFLA